MNLEQLRQYKPQIMMMAASADIHNIRVFGSVARGEANENSDVDFLVKYGKNVGWNYFSFPSELAELLKTKVDVADEEKLKSHCRDKILSEATPL